MSQQIFYTYPEEVKQEILDKVKNLDKLSLEEKKFWIDEYKVMKQIEWVDTIFFTKEELENWSYNFEDLNKLSKQKLKKSKLTTIRLPLD